MTQYLLMIYADEKLEPNPSGDEFKAYMGAYAAFTEDIRKKGQLVAGDALTPVATATTVRVREGKTITTDGPFAETKEQLGGYYLVEAKDLDEARAIAARIPSAAHGSIEIRPIMVW